MSGTTDIRTGGRPGPDTLSRKRAERAAPPRPARPGRRPAPASGGSRPVAGAGRETPQAPAGRESARGTVTRAPGGEARQQAHRRAAPGAPAGRKGTRGAAQRAPGAVTGPKPAVRGGQGARPGVPRARSRPLGRTKVGTRTSFIVLVVGLLGGSLLCLLLINTVLDTGSFQITQLQRENVTLTQREQVLQEHIYTEESDAAIARRARKLGMVSPPLLHFLNLPKGRIDSQPARDPGVPVVPGYVP